jgi:molybdopterin converting factor small subunit
MKIFIHLYATLARYLPQTAKADGGRVEVAEGMRVGELIDLLKIPGDQVKLIFVDGLHAGRDTVLKDGARLGVFPPVGGG